MLLASEHLPKRIRTDASSVGHGLVGHDLGHPTLVQIC